MDLGSMTAAGKSGRRERRQFLWDLGVWSKLFWSLALELDTFSGKGDMVLLKARTPWHRAP